MYPNPDQALQFAVMLQAGLPAVEAILYFIEVETPAELALITQKWLRSRAVKKAMTQLMGTAWQDMTLEARIDYALNLHYSALAYYLFSHNYADLSPTEKSKADSARQALEAKVAGMAGKTDALSRFFDDIKSGKVKLGMPVSFPAPHAQAS